jgi:hypothetical protein
VSITKRTYAIFLKNCHAIFSVSITITKIKKIYFFIGPGILAADPAAKKNLTAAALP